MTRRSIALLALCVACGVSTTMMLFAGGGATLQAPDAKPPAAVVVPAKTDRVLGNPRVYKGPRSCFLCHRTGIGDVASDPAVAALFPNMVDDSWCLLNELTTWSAKDKHSQAYTSLLNARSKRMGEIMGVKEIHRDRRCLACHTAFPIDDLELEPHEKDSVDVLVAKSLETDSRLTLGVSCEGCHGPAGDGGDEKGWYEAHASKTPWRFESMSKKQRNYGFFDVRNSEPKATNCLSCHLGDAREGRVVTHEMYAAGHPPLPGFETRTFLDQMPKHWRDFADKGANIKKEFVEKTKLDYDPQELYRTKDLLIGAVVAARENYRLSLDLAGGTLNGLPSKAEWPELSQFDCFACHHDLQDAGWRQARPQGGATGTVPGRPLLREWPTALADVALSIAGSRPIAVQAAGINATLAAQPFGDPAEFRRAAGTAVENLDAAVRKLQSTKVSRKVGERVRRALVDYAIEEFYDYDSARQILWAFQQVNAELGDSTPKIDTLVNGLASNFVLDLKAGRAVDVVVPGTTQARPVREVDLTKTLPPIAEFNPATFREAFEQIAKALDEAEAS